MIKFYLVFAVINDSLLMKLSQTTHQSGVYQMFDSSGEIIYIGKAKNLKKRLGSYFSGRAKDTKTTKLVNTIADFTVIVVNSEIEALLLENELIKKYQPKYNILLKDAKSYPYIIITKEKHPRISFYRGTKTQDYHYFGPYPSAQFVREAIALLRKIFGLRECAQSVYAHRSRPCLDYQIHICLAPCVFDTKEYQENVALALLFLQGKSTEVLESMRTKMLSASQNMDFELAAKYRDQMIQLRRLGGSEESDLDLDIVYVVQQGHTFLVQLIFVRLGKQIDSEYIIPKHSGNSTLKEVLSSFIPLYYMDKQITNAIVVVQDIARRELLAKSLGCKLIKRIDKDKQKFVRIAELTATENLKQHLQASKRINKQLLAIQNILGLSKVPNEIECFDISHHHGEDTVASCVRFSEGKPHKKAYKKFNLKTVTDGDDYKAMAEALSRRYREMKNIPDILLIDGGVGQLGVAYQVFSEKEFTPFIVGIAKGEGRKAGLETLIVRVGNGVQKISLRPDDSALHLLNYVRDEAHRFAITTHRKKSIKRKTTFALENIEGIGPQKSKALLTYFGSLEQIKSASITELTQAPGINTTLAQNIKQFLL